ncbi:MAG: glucose-1-phosphate cytidylyltransferase [Flavobacteriales bacterium]
MKTVIFAGGMGTRISEESVLKPKPMIEIGGKPILWHIMKIYSQYGFNDFIVCLGYKGHMIKEFFINYFLYNSDLTVKLRNNKIDVHFTNTEEFTVTLIDTGLHTNTAGRLKQVEKYLNNETFMLTYGDGVTDININQLIDFHKSHGKLATLSSVKNTSRFGEVESNADGVVTSFKEKSEDQSSWINAGYFVLEPGIFNYLREDMTDIQWEKKPLVDIANDGQLVAFKHEGFWKCMDSMRDKTELEELWDKGDAQWKIW